MFATRNYTTLDNVDQTPAQPTSPQPTRANKIIWTLLAFQAGWINSGGFLACYRFVTHTTGFATQFGIDLAAAKWSDAIGMATVPLFFMAGAMVSGFFIDRRINSNQAPLFHISYLLTTCFLILVAALGQTGQFGVFGENYNPSRSYLLIALLCLASGIQNAVTTTATNHTVRTTHMTGHTTDLGIGLVRLMTQKNKEALAQESQKLQVRLLIIGGFIVGSVISTFVFMKISFIGFLAPAVISAGLYWHTKRKYLNHA